MRVCFVYPDIEGAQHYGSKKYYHGIGYLSSVLKANGHQTSLIYLAGMMSRDAFLRAVALRSPDLVAFSSTTNQFPYARLYAGYVKEEAPKLPIIVGGTHPTLTPEESVLVPEFDYICVGEGEYALLELCTALQAGGDTTKIKNIWQRRDGQVIRTPMRPLIQNLEAIPFADREVFDFEEILKQDNGWVDMMAGRGCPYDCSYCCNPGLKDTFHGLGKYTRYRPVENVMAEIENLEKTYHFKTLNFQDDVFTLKHDWTHEFCVSYTAHGFKYPFWVNTRVERVEDEAVVKELAAAGCRGIRVGLESGNEVLRKDVLKRRMSNETIRKTFRLVQKYGMETYTCNMLGLPGETPAMIQETIDFNRELSPTQLQFSVFYPYPMTELHDIAVEKGYYKEGDHTTSYYDKKSLLTLPTLTQEQISYYYDKFSELKWELDLKRRSPTKHKLYTLLRYLYRDDTPRLHRHLDALRRVKSRVLGRRPSVVHTSVVSSQTSR